MSIRWSVIGVGIAGRARGRAILSDPRCELVAVHRGRFAGELGAPDLPLDRAIAEADAVAVCSPTPCHPQHVAAALEAGKHVVVEFPVAPDAATAEALLALAASLGRILHVEHIELLDPAQQVLGARVGPADVTAVSVTFERPGPGGSPGAIALGNVARVHRAVAVVGELDRIEAIDATPGSLRATAVSRSGVAVTFAFRESPELSRATRVEVHTASACWTLGDRALSVRDARSTESRAVPLPSGPGLFAADHAVAMDRILTGSPGYLGDHRLLHVLEVVDALGAGRVGPLPSRTHPPG